MKLALIFLILSLSIPGWTTETDFQKVRLEIEKQSVNPQSALSNELRNLIHSNQLPESSFFVLAGPDLLWPGKTQSLQECTNSDCFFYERAFFNQISDLRWKSADGRMIRSWLISIGAQILRIWNSDSNGQKLSLAKEEIKITYISMATAK